MGLDRFTTRANRALGPSSCGFKDHGTHNAPPLLGKNFVLFQSGENIVLLNIRYGKLKGLGEMMRTLNVSEDEVHLDIKRVGSARFQHFCGACYFDDTFDALVNVEPLCIGVALRVLFLLRFHRTICLLQFLSPVLLQTFLSKESLEIP